MEASERNEPVGSESPESAHEPQAAEPSPAISTDDSSEPSSSERETPEAQQPEPVEATPGQVSDPAAEGGSQVDEESGPLVGTTSELQPGTGVGGSHPAPAVMRDPDGTVHSAGLPPAGNAAGEAAPVGDESDQASESGFLTPEAREELEAVHEPEQVETERPDLGTP